MPPRAEKIFWLCVLWALFAHCMYAVRHPWELDRLIQCSTFDVKHCPVVHCPVALLTLQKLEHGECTF